MKILHFIDNFDFADGCAKAVFLLAREQKLKGNEVTVCYGEGRAAKLLEEANIDSIELNGIAHRRRTVLNFVRGIVQVRLLVQRFQPDIIHAHHFYCGNQSRIARIGTRLKIVQTVHSAADFEGMLPQFVGDSIIAVGEQVRDLVRRKTKQGRKNVFVVHNSSDFFGDEAGIRASEGYRQILDKHGASIVVGFFGRIEAEKGIWVLIDALRSLRGRLPIVLVVAGDGREKASMEQVARDAKIDAVFFGEVENIRPILELCNVVILPSIVLEGDPMIILEAGLLGKAVIASSVGGVPEIIEHGVSGLLVQPGNSGEIVHAIRELNDSAELRKRLGANLQQKVVARNNVTAMADSIEKVYRSTRSGS